MAGWGSVVGQGCLEISGSWDLGEAKSWLGCGRFGWDFGRFPSRLGSDLGDAVGIWDVLFG